MTKQYLIIHTTGGWQKQPNGAWTTGEHLMDFFFSPKKLKNGTIQYKNKVYASQSQIPNERLPFSKLSVRKVTPDGHGWDRGGYHKLIAGDGSVFEAYPDDFMTFGVRNSPDGLITNSNTIHLNWIGGLAKIKDQYGERLVPVDNRTAAQKVMLANLVLEYLKKYPKLIVAGHYQVNNNRVCPIFDVPDFLVSLGVAETHIYRKDPWGVGKLLK